MDIKPLPDKSLQHYCDLHPVALASPDTPIDVRHINPSCIRAMYRRGLIEYEFITANNKTEKRILFTKLGLKYGCESLALGGVDSKGKRTRATLRVYLDLERDDHQQAWDIARSLAGERILTPTIIDFLLMHSEFMKNKTDTLSEAYPGIFKLLSEAKIEDVMTRLEGLIQNAPQPSDNSPQKPVGLKAMASGSVGIKGAGIKGLGNIGTLPPPVFDDDDLPALTITQSKGAGNQANRNLINAMKALQDS
jgi:hypothetical protein